MDIQQLRYFVRICHTRSFSKAANECFVSAQGISMAIRRLEDYLSCKLFERSAKGVTLTEHARYLLPIARKITEQFDICEEYFNSINDTDKTLSVMFTRGIVNEFASAPIAEFGRRHPKVFFEIRHGYDADCEDALDTFEVELALTAGPINRAKYIAEFVHSNQYGIIVHKNDPIANRKTVNIRDLERRPIILMRERQKTFSVISTAAESAGISLNVLMWADDMLLTYYEYSDIEKATGISTQSLLPHIDIANFNFIPFDDPIISWNVYLVSLLGRELSHPAQMFSQLVRQYRDNILANGTSNGK